MGIHAINLARTTRWVSSRDTDKGDPTKETAFHFRLLDAHQIGQLQDQLMGFSQLDGKGGQSAQINMGRVSILAFSMACQKIENFVEEETGNPVEFKTERKNIGGKTYPVVSDEIMRRIPGWLISEAYTEIQAMNGLTEDDQKKSA